MRCGLRRWRSSILASLAPLLYHSPNLPIPHSFFMSRLMSLVQVRADKFFWTARTGVYLVRPIFIFISKWCPAESEALPNSRFNLCLARCSALTKDLSHPASVHMNGFSAAGVDMVRSLSSSLGLHVTSHLIELKLKSTFQVGKQQI